MLTIYLYFHHIFFFFNDTATTEIYTLSLHDALPICAACRNCSDTRTWSRPRFIRDRKSTRLNSSHGSISYAVFCLKKKKNKLIYLLVEEKELYMVKLGNACRFI